jgi:hypothetical protein
MRSAVFLLVGLILIGTGVGIYFMMEKMTDGVGIENAPVDLSWVKGGLRYAVAGGVGGLGVLFTLGGLIGVAKGSKKKQEGARIMLSGTEALAKVTFVDKNYSMLVNRKPIYSIVEYVYEDKYGQQHTNRIENMNSDQVIRLQIQVGGTVRIKYANDDPGKSIIAT